MGLLPTTRSRPPNANIVGPALVVANPAMSCGTAIRAKCAAAPKCRLRRVIPVAAPASRAFSITARIVSAPATWPGAESPSTSTVAAVSRTTRTLGRGFISPSSSKPE